MEPPGVTTRAGARKRGRLQPQPLPAPPVARRRLEASEDPPVFHEVVTFTPDPLPARCYDKDSGRPVSFYLSSLEELLAWTPTDDDGFNVASTPLAARQPPLSSPRPRTLLCHDMMGGYLDDRFIQGCRAAQPFAFYHWQLVDIFVYFSHHAVTVPPVGWTNAAHRHGVCVLGTFITEWKEGGRLCEAFLAGDERSFRAVADQLVRVAQFFGFDGWLVNIENSLSLAAVGNMPRFLRYLTAELHQLVPGGLVLWYDSVVASGQLKWQDELNEHNRVFFEACDGFFTNYNWREEHLERMLAQAGPRRADVYVGVDVFARGNVVGGRFDTDKSLELIRKHGFSAALFAPGWVYECLDKKDFLQNQNRFWSLLERFLPTHSISTLPFITFFCLGMGTHRVCYGQEEEAGPWYHLSAQEPQPLLGERALGGDGQGWVRTHCCLTDVWHGGSSLCVQGRFPPDVGSVAVRLFSLNVPMPPRIFLSVVYKLRGPPGVRLSLELTTEADSCRVDSVSELSAEERPRLRPQPLRLLPTKLARLVGPCGPQLRAGWYQRCYQVSLQGCLLCDLYVSFFRRSGSRDEEDFLCHLGEVQVVDASTLLTPLARVRDVTVSQVGWRPAGSEGAGLRLSCTLRWSHPPPARCYRVHCRGQAGGAAGPDGPEEPTLLGRAFVLQYRVVDLAVVAPAPGREARVEFLVEPVPREGFRVPRAEWGRAELLYSAPA